MILLSSSKINVNFYLFNELKERSPVPNLSFRNIGQYKDVRPDSQPLKY